MRSFLKVTLLVLALLPATSVVAAGETKTGSSGGSSSDGAGGVEMKTEPGTPATTNSDTVTWKCGGTFEAVAVSDSGAKQSCGDVKQMDKGLATAMAKAIPYCFRKEGGDDAIKNIKVEHVGCFNDRNKNVPGGGSTEKSEHAFGRAIDLTALHVEYASGTKKDYNFNTTKGEAPNVEEVDKFRKCWSDSISGMDEGAAKAMAMGSGEKLCGGSGGGAQNSSSTHVSGSIWSAKKSQLDPKNSLHDDHLHIECLSKDGK